MAIAISGGLSGTCMRRRGGDQGFQDTLLAAEFGIELTLGHLGAGGDLERAGAGIALVHQHRECCRQDGPLARWQVVEGGMLGSGGRGEFWGGFYHVYPLD